MTPDPAPYGSDLPRERPGADGTLGGYPRDAKWRELRAALDAANAEVLALRAERDALREVVEAVREQVHRHRESPDFALGWDEIRVHGWDAAMGSIRLLLPAPTEPSNLYPSARGAVAPTTTPQALGGSGANTGEVGRG